MAEELPKKLEVGLARKLPEKLAKKSLSSPPQTEINISASVTKDNFLKITIIDQGFGMTTDQIQTAFVKYKTIPNPNSGTVDSFGLGLPITKQLVESQNGSINIKSQVAQGTQVTLKFPY